MYSRQSQRIQGRVSVFKVESVYLLYFTMHGVFIFVIHSHFQVKKESFKVSVLVAFTMHAY